MQGENLSEAVKWVTREALPVVGGRRPTWPFGELRR